MKITLMTQGTLCKVCLKTVVRGALAAALVSAGGLLLAAAGGFRTAAPHLSVEKLRDLSAPVPQSKAPAAHARGLVSEKRKERRSVLRKIDFSQRKFRFA